MSKYYEDARPLIISHDGKPIDVVNVSVVCAWCGTTIKGDPDLTPISHGICDKCKAREMGGEG